MARLAFPDVAYPVLIDVFRPFGDDQPLATLGAFDDRSVAGTNMHEHPITFARSSLLRNVERQSQLVVGRHLCICRQTQECRS
jgi:hypothetical protein